MNITELEKKLKNKTITPGEKVLLETKKKIEEAKKKGVVYFEENKIAKKSMNMNF